MCFTLDCIQSHQLLKAISEGSVRIALSTPLLFEYEGVPKRNQAVLNLSDSEVDVMLDPKFLCWKTS